MDKKKLSIKLDNLAKNVANRGVFVVNKHPDGLFFVEEHISKKVIYSDLPIKQTAEKLCAMHNKGKSINSAKKIELKNLVERYFKFKNDIMFYKHTIKTTSDNFTYLSAVARCNDALKHFNKVCETLKNF